MGSGLVLVGSVRIPFCCAAEAALLPPCKAGECFLLAPNVAACGVDLVVPLRLEIV